MNCICLFIIYRQLKNGNIVVKFYTSWSVNLSKHLYTYFLLCYFPFLTDDISEPHDSPFITEPKKITTIGMLNSEAKINTFSFFTVTADRISH